MLLPTRVITDPTSWFTVEHGSILPKVEELEKNSIPLQHDNHIDFFQNMRKGLSHGNELQVPSTGYQTSRKVSISDFVSKRVNVNLPNDTQSFSKDPSLIETDSF